MKFEIGERPAVLGLWPASPIARQAASSAQCPRRWRGVLPCRRIGFEGQPHLASHDARKSSSTPAPKCQVSTSLSKSSSESGAAPGCRCGRGDDKAFGGECLHRFAQHGARYVEARSEIGVAG